MNIRMGKYYISSIPTKKHHSNIVYVDTNKKNCYHYQNLDWRYNKSKNSPVSSHIVIGFTPNPNKFLDIFFTFGIIEDAYSFR